MLCGGGTGGHVFPLVEIARGIKKIRPESKIYFVGPEEFPLNSLSEEGVLVKRIIGAGKIRRYFSILYAWELIKLPFAFLQAFFVVAFINPDFVLGKGSYGSVLPVFCARILGKRILLHESDAIPGLANKFLSKFTKNIAVSFEDTKKFFPNKNVFLSGNPVRLKYLDITKDDARKILEFYPENKVIFISGGSQGAQKINNIFLDSLENVLKNYSVIWSTGSKNFNLIKGYISNKKNIKISPIFSEKELAAAYTLCDIIIGRAGSGTIFETAAFGKPSILIPLERKGGDQPFNASYYEKTGSSVTLKESNLTGDLLIKEIDNILSSETIIENMSEKAKKFAKINAGEEIAQILLSL